MRTGAILLALMLPLMGAKCSAPIPADMIKQVQDKAKDVCGYVPLASTVGAIVAGATGLGAGAAAGTMVANQICAAVAASSSVHGLKSSEPEVNGVPVQGQVVDQEKFDAYKATHR